MSAGRAAALLAVALGMLGYCALRLHVGTDLTNFMPDGSRSELARLSSRLTDSPFTRTMVLTLHSEPLDRALVAARKLAAALESHPQIAWVRVAAGEEELEPLYRLYFPRRNYFLSDDPERAIPKLVSDAALRERARALKRRLATPLSPLLERIAPADPLGAFETLASRIQAGEAGLTSERGQLVTRDRRYAVVLAATRGSAFDSSVQMGLLEDLERDFASISAELGGGVSLELAGANRFAVAAEKSMKRDVYAIGTLSFLGVSALFVAFVGSLRGFLVVVLPPLAGILTATSLGLLCFGRLDGLTMVFGASLMGIAVDYSIHLLIHQGLAPAGSPRDTERRLRPSLALGAFTTMASLAGLAITAFPAFREMSFFAGVGVLAALAVSLGVLPDLIGRAARLPALSARAARGLGALLDRLEALPRALLVLPLALVCAALPLLGSLHWQDDMSRLTRFDPQLVQEERRVRERVAGPETDRFVIALAPDADAAVALNDRIHTRLTAAVSAGELEGMRSLHALLWSEDLQRRNRRALRAEGDLATRLEAAFAAEGFRPEALRPFRDSLAAPPPPPLRLADLQASPLADLLAPFVIPVDGKLALVTYLRGVHRPDALGARLADLDGVHLMDQRSFVNDVYREFRRTTLRQMLVGAGLVVLLLVLRYRAWRPVFASVLPTLAVVVLVLGGLALLDVPLTLLHVLALVLVTGMGVDYGIFLVDSARGRGAVGATMLSLLLSCLTTAFVFGALAFSSQPALRAIGVTTGVGILLSYLLAPVALAASGLRGGAGEAR